MRCGAYLSTSSVFQSEAEFYDAADPARLLPELLDRLIALGELAQRLSHALGGNGHRPEKAGELIEELINGR